MNAEPQDAPDVNTGKLPPGEVRRMFARIAPTYDLLNRVLSAGRDRAWRAQVARALDGSARRVLDLCTGTGDLALEIARRRPDAEVWAGDFCVEMLQRGRSKGLEAHTRPVALDALRLPFRSGTFDAITVAFGVRNWDDLDRGLIEARRVLRPGGQLAVVEFFRSDSAWRDRPFRLYFQHVLPRIGGWVSRDPGAYTYLPRSVGRFVTRNAFAAELARAGFDGVERRELSWGVASLFLARARAAAPREPGSVDSASAAP